MTVQALILAGILGYHYRHVISYLVNIWTNNGDWSHGFIIPLFSLYYLYLRRNRMPLGLEDHNLAARVAGGLLLTVAFTIYVYCTMAKITYPKNLALVTSVLGAVMMTCGWNWTRWSWFAIAFLLFALPIPQRLYFQLTFPLREIAANVSAAVLALLPGMETEVRGAVVDYFYRGKADTLDIEQACSGMRLMMTMTALGVAMAFVSERPLWHRLIMILACVPIAIFCNMIRVTTTGFMVVLGRNDLAKGFWHMMLGLGMLAIAFSLYGAISYVLNHLFESEEKVFTIPKGLFTKAFASADNIVFMNTMATIEKMVLNGDRSGLDELESFIRHNSPNKNIWKFETPGLRAFHGGINENQIIKQFVTWAKKDGILSHISEVQSLLSPLVMMGTLSPQAIKGVLDQAKTSVNEAAGFHESRALDLLISHKMLNSTWLARDREMGKHPTGNRHG